MKTRPDRKKMMSFLEAVATNLVESGVETRATKRLVPCVTDYDIVAKILI